MYKHEPDNYICPLCQISRGERTELGDQEPTVVFRDDLITAFIAGKWWKSSKGHVIVIPNEHIENIYILPDNINHRIADFSKEMAGQSNSPQRASRS
jgi:histidine triad (HIT) family protein